MCEVHFLFQLHTVSHISFLCHWSCSVSFLHSFRGGPANSPVKFRIFINPKVCLKSGIWLLWCSVYRWGPGACGCAGHVLCLFCVCPLQWLLNLEASLSLSASEVSCINWKLGQFAAITSPISVSEPIWGKSSYVAGGKKSQGIHTITYH